MSLEATFKQATEDVKQLPEAPDNMTKLKLYALFKQATEGDVQGKRPGFAEMIARAKWDAWNDLAGTSKDDAMRKYADLVASLK